MLTEERNRTDTKHSRRLRLCNFFHKNDRKGCKRDYLYALGNFLSVLERPRKKRKGGCNNPPWIDEG